VGGAWRVEDLGSTNGTTLDDSRVRDADLTRPSALLRLGDSVLPVREIGALGALEEPDVARAATFGSLTTRSPVMERLLGMLARVAPSDTTVLLQGETGAAELFTPEVLAELQSHPWPGTVRELRNYVERTSVLRKVVPSHGGTHRIVTAPELHVDLDLSFREAKEAAMAAFDRSYLGALIRWSGGNVSLAARRAGMDRIHLHRLLQRQGLKVPPARTVA
jgi:DNA-binding NtrC family response regulator